MASISNRAPSIVVTYDKGRTRARKVFRGVKGAFAARRFYATKLKAGANPQLAKTKPEEDQ